METSRELPLRRRKVTPARIGRICFMLADKLTDGRWANEEILNARIERSVTDGPGLLAYDDDVDPTMFETGYLFSANKSPNQDHTGFEVSYGISRTVSREVAAESIPELVMESAFNSDGQPIIGEIDYIQRDEVDGYEVFHEFEDRYVIDLGGNLVDYGLNYSYTIDGTEVWNEDYSSEWSPLNWTPTFCLDSVAIENKPVILQSLNEDDIASDILKLDDDIANILTIEEVAASMDPTRSPQDEHQKMVMHMLGSVSVGLLRRQMFS